MPYNTINDIRPLYCVICVADNRLQNEQLKLAHSLIYILGSENLEYRSHLQEGIKTMRPMLIVSPVNAYVLTLTGLLQGLSEILKTVDLVDPVPNSYVSKPVQPNSLFFQPHITTCWHCENSHGNSCSSKPLIMINPKSKSWPMRFVNEQFFPIYIVRVIQRHIFCPSIEVRGNRRPLEDW